MTGFGNEEDKQRTRAAGFDAHLTKPVELDALVTLLNEARTRNALAAAGSGAECGGLAAPCTPSRGGRARPRQAHLTV
jgi:DNA-binding response OmpR family regulator